MKIEKGKWTLFLDRDGVINQRLPQRYVKNWEQFDFLPGTLKAMPMFRSIFKRIIVVTNQQGIGKSLMTLDELAWIHQKMIAAIESAGGHIDKIYFCDQLANEKLSHRKPNPYMAFQAKNDFPEINFEQSIMVGDQESDIEFGKNVGMKTVWIPNSPSEKWKRKDLITDEVHDDLLSFAKKLIIIDE
jgi:histidinol-phosphate phosphatase family protein